MLRPKPGALPTGAKTFDGTTRKSARLLRTGFGFAVLAGLIFWYVHPSIMAAQASADANDSSGVTMLTSLGNAALHEHRLVAPEGSNAYEFYASALQLDALNKQAIAGLRTSFEPACHDVEDTIAKGSLDEAERELRLLHDYAQRQNIESDNFRVALLGSYLHAQRNLLMSRHEAEAFRMRSQAASAAN